MKKIFLVIIGLLFFAHYSFANISVFPFYISFNADSNKRSEQVRLTNTTKNKQVYRIELVHYKQKKDGSYTEIKEKENKFSASPYIEFSPREVTLEPRQTQVIRIQRKVMSTALTGEYVAHLKMQEIAMPVSDEASVKGGISIDLKALYGITIPIMIEKGELTNFATIKTAVWKMGKDLPMSTVTVSREGTRSVYGKIVILEDKTEIGRIDNFRIFVGTPERILNIPLIKKPNGKISIQLWDARSDVILSTLSI